MLPILTLIRRYPTISYFALTFAISWGVVLIVAGPGGIPGTPEQQAELLPIMVLALLTGPSVAGLLTTGLVHGRAGLGELRSRLLRWRVRGRWYAVALLTAPLLVLATLLVLSLFSPDYLPGLFTSDEKASLILIGLAYGLAAGFFEELGWTGVAIPQLRQRCGVLATGLIVGVLWGAWHIIVAFWGSGDAAGALSLTLLLPQIAFYVAILPAYRVLMVWVYDRTGSLFVAMLMHACLTASVPLILMPPVTGMALSMWYLVLAAAMWAVVGAIVVASGGQIARPRLNRRAA